MNPTSTLLFHLSDELTDVIAPASEKRPKFYWFNDVYHSHIPSALPSNDYMYFFVLKPTESDAKLFTRHDTGDFASMWVDYVGYLKDRTLNVSNNPGDYFEPGIVFSFSEMVPAVVGKFVNGFTLWAKTIDESKEATFSLVENGKYRRFDEIPELVSLLPDLVTAAPILCPSPEQIAEPSDFWPADKANEGRKWL
jgi:hypothetical protein